MDFRNFFISYVFEVKEFISRSFTKLPYSGDLENLSQLPVSGTPGYCQFGLMDFSNFFIPYVFDVKESVYRGFTRSLFSFSQLPVLQGISKVTVGSYGFS